MSGILEFLIGTGVGVAGTLSIKGNGNSKRFNKLKRELDETLAENEKLHRRYKEAERLNENLQSKLTNQQRSMKSSSSVRDDLQDELDDALRKIKHLTAENANLHRKIEEYKNILKSNENL